MSLHERSRAATLFHSVVAVLLLVCGGALFGFGIWLHRTDNGPPGELQIAGWNRIQLALNAAWGAVGVGAFLVLSGVLSLLAMGRSCVGGLFRVLYLLMAMVIAAVLIIVCGAAAASAHSGTAPTRDVLAAAWAATAVAAPAEVCELEKRFECRGFADRECMRCPTGFEGAGCEAVPNCVRCDGGARSDFGCYTKIVEEMRRVFRPVAVIAGLLAAVVIVDIVITCCL